MPQCDAWGQAPVTSEVFDVGCKIGDSFVENAWYDCNDDRTIAWNAWGWGFIGDVWTQHAAAELIAPRAVLETCLDAVAG